LVLGEIEGMEGGGFHEGELSDTVFAHVELDNDIVLVIVFGTEEELDILNVVTAQSDILQALEGLQVDLLELIAVEVDALDFG
jgi:hypothetical protein